MEHFSREWEEFDQGNMVCGNLDNMDDVGETKIVLGSFSGILRVYKPSIPEYNVADLILEEDLGAHPAASIGQILSGHESTGVGCVAPEKISSV